MSWAFDSKKTGPAGYQNMESTYRDESSPPPPSPSQPRYGQVLTILITCLCLAGLVATICLSLRPALATHMYQIVLPERLETIPEQLYTEFVPVIEHSSGGWSRLGHLPPPDTPDPKVDPEPSESKLGSYEYAAVSVDSIPCAKIGKDVMLMGGNAIDSSIATMYCNTVVNSQSMGVGGGFIMTIYMANGTKLALIARETAPAAASKDMYHGNENLTHYGPLASGIPGFVAGTWELKQKLGNPAVSWESLLQPAIDMCFEGIIVNNHAYHMMHQERARVMADPGLSGVFVNPETGDIWQEEDVYTFPSLGKTLRAIALNGAKEFYEGETGQKLVKDIQAAGGIITMEDLKNYQVQWETPITHKLKNLGYTLISSPPPGSGAILASILGVMDAYSLTPLDRHRPLAWHRFVEACKFGFATRTEMGDWNDPDIREYVQEIVRNLTSQEWVDHVKSQIDDTKTYLDPTHYGAKTSLTEDHGTCHHSFLSPDGDAVSVTASVNLIWGCKFLSPSTGIIMNNQMDDFASPNITSAYDVPPSPNNFIAPGKRPMSSMSTTIVVDDQGRVIAVAGASGGTKIITATAQILFRMFYLGQDVKEAIDSRRLHHQLFPMNLNYEDGITTWMRDGLVSYGHNITYSKFRVGGAAVQAIHVDPTTGTIQANADFRKRGTVDGF
eukprot:GFUD01035433.1.p1 GENE.GFUD01035433.1~~GFUD01035433.1.p1  ORF type:complete len:688 (+),score=179.86 GFUD01035433.1:54-2066(+)